MTKILYILPALAVLGLFSAAYAETDQQRIDRFEAKIAELEAQDAGGDAAQAEHGTS